jgi:hypothetical protein
MQDELRLIRYVEQAFKRIGQSAIKSEELCKIINTLYQLETMERQFPVNGVKLRKMVNYIRKNGILPIIATSRGYFVTYEKELIEKQIKSLNERAAGIKDAANGMLRYL